MPLSPHSEHALSLSKGPALSVSNRPALSLSNGPALSLSKGCLDRGQEQGERRSSGDEFPCA